MPKSPADAILLPFMENLIRNDEIIDETRKLGIELNATTIEYYMFLKLIPRSQKVKGDNRGYQPHSIIRDFYTIHFMQKHLGLSLKEISSFVKKFKPQTLILQNKETKVRNIFIRWVDLTYTVFFETVFNGKNSPAKRNGIKSVLFINWIYKNLLQEEGIPFLVKSLKEKSNKKIPDLTQMAKTWAKKISIPFNS